MRMAFGAALTVAVTIAGCSGKVSSHPSALDGGAPTDALRTEVPTLCAHACANRCVLSQAHMECTPNCSDEVCAKLCAQGSQFIEDLAPQCASENLREYECLGTARCTADGSNPCAAEVEALSTCTHAPLPGRIACESFYGHGSRRPDGTLDTVPCSLGFTQCSDRNVYEISCPPGALLDGGRGAPTTCNCLVNGSIQSSFDTTECPLRPNDSLTVHPPCGWTVQWVL